MITILFYDSDKEEQQLLIYDSENAVAYSSDERLKKEILEEESKVSRFIEEHGLLDGAFMEVTEEEGILMTKELRKEYKELELLLVSDDSISPMKYITPDIRASSLLLRPFTKEESERVIREFFGALLRERNKTNKRLVLENKDGKLSIPFTKIYYIEVRDKRLYIRLKNQEYSKYGTLESIEKALPENFLKCHRSYIVNEDYISQIKLAENAVFLENGIRIPLSRTYKPEVKAFLERR